MVFMDDRLTTKIKPAKKFDYTIDIIYDVVYNIYDYTVHNGRECMHLRKLNP